MPLTDAQWARIEPLLPDRTPERGGRWRDHREVIDAIAFKGVVALLSTWLSDGVPGRGGRAARVYSDCGGLAGGAGDPVPDDEADGHLGSVAGGGHQVAAGSEVG
ncbi:transposase [Streptomyces sp. NPDC052701]|uniref:transposase n=1 Tax=Streptomyces sp. NPDC052701 TaxID=3155533 RepID=UPI003417C24C